MSRTAVGRTLRRLATPPRLLAFGVATFIAGRLLDAWWHAGHDEFETGTDQLQAHWLVWIGALLVMAAAAQGVRERRSPGYSVALAGALGYAVVAAWHFYEHTERREVDVTHLVLVVTNLVILTGVVWVAIEAARGMPRRANASTPEARGR
jgi:hypothetical protein